MPRSKQPLWCFTIREEYPPERRLVWTTDGKQVVKGRYTPPDAILEGAPLEEGAWTDEHGEPIAVKAWLPIEDSPGVPPELPKSFPGNKPDRHIRLHDHELYPWAGTIWTRYKTGDTTPPTGEPCWTFDGNTVRKGNWRMFEPLKWDDEGWPEGEWRGMEGELITVTHWLDISEDDESTPEPPEE